ncbi:acyl-CoA N-acyltransferase [Hypoxylon trugodes]|uniref:acyl-CoA N-acyltransferase n=1 Tax=Hypoxylon trugodes TaxID=326681 RepID=UPI002199E2B7|nr:acyl-CoA N-acyltransferase [Hypoxylon trugodes]KAI1383140.1 acyl-CoA N-acyltransferase [Hypoxylon trugodes]
MTLPFPHPTSLLPPGFAIYRCTPGDVPSMVDVCKSFLSLTKAFPAGSPFTYWWSPSLEVMQTWHTTRIRSRFADPNTQQFKVVDETTGKPVAFAKWDPPKSMKGLKHGFVTYDNEGKVVEQTAKSEGREKEENKAPPPILEAPKGADEALYQEFFEALKTMGKKWNTDEKLVLSVICTDPAYHGRGIGAALANSVLTIADTEKVSAYLEALPLAVPLYRRLGFEPVDHLEFDITRAGMEGTALLTIMVREPKSPN